MGHHLTADNHFQSDKPIRIKGTKKKAILGVDLLAVSFNHTEAWPALELLADGYDETDSEFAEDIRVALAAAKRRLWDQNQEKA